MRKITNYCKISLQIIVAGLAIIMLAPSVFAAPDLPAPPNQDLYVFDYAQIVDASLAGQLHYELKALEKETSTEIVIVTVETLQGYSIEEFAIELARKWGIGQKEHNNGLLLLVAPNEKQVRIEVGYGLEGAITDAQSSYIVRNVMIPYFKNEEYGRGIAAGIAELEKLARGEEFTQTQEQETSTSDGIFFLIYLLPFIWVLLSWFSQSKSWWLGGVFGGIIGVIAAGVTGIVIGGLIGLVLDFVLSTFFYGKIKPPRGGGFFFGGGGSSGGGFGGFGGGGFGGGGASGSW